MDIIGKTRIFLILATLLVLLGWFSILYFGLQPGIDLEGGTQWQVSANDNVSEGDLEQFFRDELGASASVKTIAGEEFLIRLPELEEDTHQEYKRSLVEKFGEIEERSFSSVGPVVGEELREKSIWAIIVVLLGISLFVAWAFRKVSRPINSWKYGITTLVTLFHDVSIPVGVFAFLGWRYGFEIDTTLIVALLVVLGFSVNDTIVVFDRIRENILRVQGKLDLKSIINQSIQETLARSINTSLTLILVLIALIVLGPSSLFQFVLTVLIGTVVGTYSSIFVASPILYIWGKE